MEDETLALQAAGNARQQFANPPDLDEAVTDAIIDGLGACTGLGKQALDREEVRRGVKAILLWPCGLWETLRQSGASSPPGGNTPAGPP